MKIRIQPLTVLLTAGIVLLMTALCPYLSDDWHFMFIWEDFDPLPETRRAETLQDILISMQNYYQKSGGRVIPHFIAYTLMMQSKWIFNLLNSVMFSLYCYLTYRIVRVSSKWDNPFLFPLVSLLSFMCLPFFGDNVLWLSGSTNYLWTDVLLLSCILWILTRWEKAKTGEFLLMLPVFLLSASTNEVTGGMLAVSLILFVLHTERKQLRRCVLLLPVIFLGMGLVLLAQGNTARRITVEKKTELSLPDFLDMILIYWHYLNANYRIIMLLLMTGCMLSLIRHRNLRKFVSENYLFLIGMSGITALGAVGFFTGRPIIFGFSLLLPAVFVSAFRTAEYYQEYKQDIFSFVLLVSRAVLYAVACMQITELFDIFRSGSNLFLIAGTMTVIILLFVLAGILPKLFPLLRISEQDRQKLSQFRQAVPRYKKPVLIAVFLVLGGTFFLNLTGYLRWTEEARTYQNALTELILEEDYKTAIQKIPERNSDSRFIPAEFYVASSYYVIEWMAFYYEKDVSDFVQEYAVPIRKGLHYEISE